MNKKQHNTSQRSTMRYKKNAKQQKKHNAMPHNTITILCNKMQLTVGDLMSEAFGKIAQKCGKIAEVVGK